MRLPSGSQRGSKTPSGRSVSFCASPPSSAITWSWFLPFAPLRVKARRPPSGVMAGSLLYTSTVVRVRALEGARHEPDPPASLIGLEVVRRHRHREHGGPERRSGRADARDRPEILGGHGARSAKRLAGRIERREGVRNQRHGGPPRWRFVAG